MPTNNASEAHFHTDLDKTTDEVRTEIDDKTPEETSLDYPSSGIDVHE